MIEDLVGALVRDHLRIGDFHAERYALLFRVTFDTAQYRNGVVCALFVRHAAPFAGKRNERGASHLRADINALVKFFLEAVVHFLPDETLLETRPASRHQCRRQAIVP